MLTPPTQPLFVAYYITLVGALTMVGVVSFLRSRGWVSPLVGRKLMHLFTGPVFILCWLLFPPTAESRWIAASVPLAVAMYMLSNALGFVRNRGLIQTVSRSGCVRELAAGPFYYGLIHAAAAAGFWTHSPTGMAGLIILCVGDGVADLVGRPYGRTKWPQNRDKSLEGSLAFVLATAVVLYAFIHLFVSMGFFMHVTWVSWHMLQHLALCSHWTLAVSHLRRLCSLLMLTVPVPMAVAHRGSGLRLDRIVAVGQF
jgi:dolichol kinase